MTAQHLSLLLALFIVLSFGVQAWLVSRQMRHVWRHRHVVPEQFRHRITAEAHHRAAEYTVARGRLQLVESALAAAIVLGFTLLGGLDRLGGWIGGRIDSPMAVQVLLVVAVVGIITLLSLPIDTYRTFVLEAGFGFNRISPGLFIADRLKGVAVAAVLGIPLLCAVLWLVRIGGSLWWLQTWLLWCGFVLLVQWLMPGVIAPLFNRFEPMPEGETANRVRALLGRCGFRSGGLYVMDGSRRSSHANAYFTGHGRQRRIVFFDTLLQRLDIDEIEAVLAHELGHFRLHHIPRLMATSLLGSLVGLALVAWLMKQPWYYAGLGVDLLPSSPLAPAVALVLAVLAAPVFTFFLRPLTALQSRRYEFEADAFAASHARPERLASALVKLFEDNASTLTPDPLYAAWHASHPPATSRIARLVGLDPSPTAIRP